MLWNLNRRIYLPCTKLFVYLDGRKVANITESKENVWNSQFSMLSLRSLRIENIDVFKKRLKSTYLEEFSLLLVVHSSQVRWKSIKALELVESLTDPSFYGYMLSKFFLYDLNNKTSYFFFSQPEWFTRKKTFFSSFLLMILCKEHNVAQLSIILLY